MEAPDMNLTITISVEGILVIMVDPGFDAGVRQCDGLART